MTTDMTPSAGLEVDLARTRRFAARLRVMFVVLDLFVCALLLVGVFVALPDRYLPVDIGASVFVLLLLASAVGIFRRAPWGARVFRLVAFVQLAVGLVLTFTTVATASWLSGVYGPVGRGGSVILGLVAALALPYLVVLPATKLLWIGAKPEPEPTSESTP